MNPAGTQCAAEVYTVHIPPIGLAGSLCIPAGAAGLVYSRMAAVQAVSVPATWRSPKGLMSKAWRRSCSIS